jgi:aminoglycoside phosphotransferase (APT) family kinase protein
MPEWAADAVVDEALARRLLRAQVPSVAAAELSLLGEGWDVTAWLVDRAWVFRFPRRAAVVPGLARELAVLPRLAPHLPAAIPAAVHVGAPSEAFPYPFAGSRHIAGAELSGNEPHDALAPALGAFLRALHAIDPASAGAAALPIDPLGRGDLAARVPRTLARLDELAAAGVWRASAELRDALAATAGLPPSTTRAIVHGDLHLRQILAEAGALTGVIDWIDICVGDPALDLSILWSLFSPAGRQAFLAHYGPVDLTAISRSRVLAVFLAATIALYAHTERRSSVLHAALACLDRAS